MVFDQWRSKSMYFRAPLFCFGPKLGRPRPYEGRYKSCKADSNSGNFQEMSAG